MIRTLLIQEGICITLSPQFKFLEVAYPYVAKRLLMDDSLRERLTQVLFKEGEFQWDRLSNLMDLAQDDSVELDLTDTIKDFVRVVARDKVLRSQMLQAVTANNQLQVQQLASLLGKLDVKLELNRVFSPNEVLSLANFLMLELSESVVAPVPIPTFRQM